MGEGHWVKAHFGNPLRAASMIALHKRAREPRQRRSQVYTENIILKKQAIVVSKLSLFIYFILIVRRTYWGHHAGTLLTRV